MLIDYNLISISQMINVIKVQTSPAVRNVIENDQFNITCVHTSNYIEKLAVAIHCIIPPFLGKDINERLQNANGTNECNQDMSSSFTGGRQ